MRRLFSTFARGWPGAALLLMRLVAGIALVQQGASHLSGGASGKVLGLAVVAIGLAALLIAGLWTPIAGALVALIETWSAYSGSADIWFCILVGTLGIALALLGPGAWSVDARLFGWKRIDIRDRKS